MQKPTVGEMQKTGIRAWLSKNRGAMLALSAGVALALCIYGVWLFDRAGDPCRSARPTLVVAASGELAGNADFLSRLENFLGYYSILQLDDGSDAFACDGIPRLALDVSITEGGARSISARLKEAATGKVHWAKSFPVEETPGYDPLTIIAARIAFELGQPLGHFEIAAIAMPWQNEPARKEFACLYHADKYFFGSDLEALDTAYKCLEKYAATSRHADISAVLASADYARQAQKSKRDDFQLSEEGQIAYARAKELEPNNWLVLQLQVVEMRDSKPQNPNYPFNLIQSIERQYPYQPAILSFISLYYGGYLDNYPKAIETAHLANLISGNQNSFEWGRIYANLGMQRWEELAKDRTDVMNFYLPDQALISLAIADYGPSPESDRENARSWLKSQNLESLEDLQTEIAGTRYTDRIKVVLSAIAQDHYGSDDQIDTSSMGKSDLTDLTIP